MIELKVIDMTEKRFINDIDNGKLIDTKGELSTIYYSDSVDFYELWEFLNKLNDENEQLKQYIYDNLDEDICDVCSYQYLEKSKMDKYYVAKCKKGYDNCSKGTVIHCKDFKFKELKSE